MFTELIAAVLLTAPPGDLPGSEASFPSEGPVYWVYVGAESEDYLHRIRFSGGSAEVYETIPVADLYVQSNVPDRLTESEAPHGVAVDPRGGRVYMTTGHGVPDGKLWQVEAGTGKLLADPLDLGRFPASLGLSPDGRLAFVVNFNLHGEMAPSSVSVISTTEMTEVARIETCTMPHGSRVESTGRFHYSVCMMDDQLVEIDARRLQVSRRFHLGTGEEGPLDVNDLGPHAHEGHDHLGHGMMYEATCSPTWVQASPQGDRTYVACNASDQVLEISVEDWEVVRRFETGRGPYNLDVTGDGRLLIVTLKQGDGVEFIDLETGESAARLDTSTRVVHGVALSPDDRYAFVSVEGIGGEPGKVDVFDLESLERVSSVEVGLQASGIAFWKMEE